MKNKVSPLSNKCMFYRLRHAELSELAAITFSRVIFIL